MKLPKTPLDYLESRIGGRGWYWRASLSYGTRSVFFDGSNKFNVLRRAVMHHRDIVAQRVARSLEP